MSTESWPILEYKDMYVIFPKQEQRTKDKAKEKMNKNEKKFI